MQQEFQNYFGTNLSDHQIYHFDQDQVNDFLEKQPWVSDPEYFKKCKISVNAALKMLIHACLGSLYPHPSYLPRKQRSHGHHAGQSPG